MSRTLRVHPQYIQTVKSIWERKSDGSERVLAEELGLALPQIHLFLKGQFLTGLDFLEICQALNLNWREVAGLHLPDSSDSTLPVASTPKNSLPNSSLDTAVLNLNQAVDELVGVLCEMLRRLTRKVGDFIRADRTSIFLLDSQRNVLGSINAEDGQGGSLVIEVPLNRGIASLAATTSSVINIPFDVYNDPRSEESKKIDKITGYRTYTILAWPLFNKEQNLVAVVQLINKLRPNCDPGVELSRRIDINGFTEADESLFATFAPSILQVLERCQFCYQLTQQLREDTQLNKHKPDIIFQKAQLITELKQQEQQLRKILDRM
ncbi:GAF domain-containing protein [Allocoleopsis franciscana]|uniref:GAF domain-containing protein n=1 Tax=Allocoleopsis franciscana PCC 7113 TaxID=1173027 RepID=K9W9Q6_9CYAN|nr:GAF domain-containing protein [Allocoleopsis franciscana]AFZ16551.1 GAF domain-containing protein [Allocoleopsis franciscana PCC 7113]